MNHDPEVKQHVNNSIGISKLINGSEDFNFSYFDVVSNHLGKCGPS